MRRFVAVGIVTVALLATSVASPAAACGCGASVGAPDSAVSTSDERAIITFDGERETIDLTFSLHSETGTAGLIIPTPQPAKISEGDLRLFDVIESTIAPRVTVEKDWWGIGYLAPKPEIEKPLPAETVPHAPLATTNLPATDTVGLNAWLVGNGFAASDEELKALDGYADLGWTLTLVTVSSDAAIDGQIAPIRLDFAATRIVYPIRLASVETEPQSVRLYVFDEERLDVVQANSNTLQIDGTVETLYAGEVTDARLAALGPYLSAFEVHYEDPGDQVTSDIGMFTSVRDGDFLPQATEYRPVTLLGIPLGTLLVVWGLLGVGLLIGHFRGRSRAR
jgi:hypothetical protein